MGGLNTIRIDFLTPVNTGITARKTHEVLDLHYHEDEGQGCFDGTQQECEEFAATQSPSFMYKVIPMTEKQIKSHPDNQNYIQ